MSPNGQMERLIRAAQDRVAENAEGASDREFTAALFGWLAYKLERCRRPAVAPYLTVGGLGAVVGGGMAAFGRALSWW